MIDAFDGKTALITGGTRGIGKAIAGRILSAGGEVVITGQTERSGWWNDEPNCTQLAVDLSSASATDAFCDQIQGRGIGLLVNNAGVFHAEPVEHFCHDKWLQLWETNVSAAMKIIQALVPEMRRADAPRIVSVSSIAAFVSRPGGVAYTTTKAAIVGFTKAVALDLAVDGILVNCVCPGYTETDMLAELDVNHREALRQKIPLGRFCRPDEVAEAVCFLLEPRNSFITGQTLIIDGGVVIQ